LVGHEDWRVVAQLPEDGLSVIAEIIGKWIQVGHGFEGNTALDIFRDYSLFIQTYESFVMPGR
jgi:hypothetical protein